MEKKKEYSRPRVKVTVQGASVRRMDSQEQRRFEAAIDSLLAEFIRNLDPAKITGENAMESSKNKWQDLGAIIVARQSDDKNGTGSTEAQLDHIRAKLAGVGMHVVDKEMLEGVSAAAPARIVEIVQRLYAAPVL